MLTTTMGLTVALGLASQTQGVCTTTEGLAGHLAHLANNLDTVLAYSANDIGSTFQGLAHHTKQICHLFSKVGCFIP